MCNNNGHCRKFDAGTMCPSWRVTRDEVHLTRGRANTLRLALSGQLGADAFTGDAVKQAFDLCVSCKGCKRDCPTGVDMARMKIEFTAQHRARHGWSWRDRLVGHLPGYARFASRVPALANLRESSATLARAAQRWFGIAAARSLPRFRRDTFWFRAGALGLSTAQTTLAAAKPVVLWVDTFNGFFDTENAVAAVAVLKTAGYAVHVPVQRGAQLCCGRTHLATGRVDLAKERATELLAALRPFAERGIAIVGLEPSCLLSLRDELLVMGLGDAAEIVSKQALMFEEFVAREAKAGRFAATFRPATQPMLVHGHCHQKAFGVVQPVLDVLALIPGAAPRLIESSCCGMAGSFGIEAEHHAVDADGRVVAAARAACGARCAGGRRRHQLPPPDRRWRRARSAARRPRARRSPVLKL
jgi:Fe-S oxidoreductase